MAKRPIDQKRRRRAAKLVSRRPLPAFIDLIDWLEDHGYADSAGAARKIILAKRVKVDSHPLGVKTVPTLQKDGVTIKMQDRVFPMVPASLRSRLTVLP